MLSAKEIAVGLVTQAKTLPLGDPRAKQLLDAAGRIMGAQLTGRRQR